MVTAKIDEFMAELMDRNKALATKWRHNEEESGASHAVVRFMSWNLNFKGDQPFLKEAMHKFVENERREQGRLVRINMITYCILKHRPDVICLQECPATMATSIAKRLNETWGREAFEISLPLLCAHSQQRGRPTATLWRTSEFTKVQVKPEVECNFLNRFGEKDEALAFTTVLKAADADRRMCVVNVHCKSTGGMEDVVEVHRQLDLLRKLYQSDLRIAIGDFNVSLDVCATNSKNTLKKFYDNMVLDPLVKIFCSNEQLRREYGFGATVRKGEVDKFHKHIVQQRIQLLGKQLPDRGFMNGSSTGQFDHAILASSAMQFRAGIETVHFLTDEIRDGMWETISKQGVPLYRYKHAKKTQKQHRKYPTTHLKAVVSQRARPHVNAVMSWLASDHCPVMLYVRPEREWKITEEEMCPTFTRSPNSSLFSNSAEEILPSKEGRLSFERFEQNDADAGSAFEQQKREGQDLTFWNDEQAENTCAHWTTNLSGLMAPKERETTDGEIELVNGKLLQLDPPLQLVDLHTPRGGDSLLWALLDSRAEIRQGGCAKEDGEPEDGFEKRKEVVKALMEVQINEASTRSRTRTADAEQLITLRESLVTYMEFFADCYYSEEWGTTDDIYSSDDPEWAIYDYQRRGEPPPVTRDVWKEYMEASKSYCDIQMVIAAALALRRNIWILTEDSDELQYVVPTQAKKTVTLVGDICFAYFPARLMYVATVRAPVDGARPPNFTSLFLEKIHLLPDMPTWDSMIIHDESKDGFWSGASNYKKPTADGKMAIETNQREEYVMVKLTVDMLLNGRCGFGSVAWKNKAANEENPDANSPAPEELADQYETQEYIDQFEARPENSGRNVQVVTVSDGEPLTLTPEKYAALFERNGFVKITELPRNQFYTVAHALGFASDEIEAGAERHGNPREFQTERPDGIWHLCLLYPGLVKLKNMRIFTLTLFSLEVELIESAENVSTPRRRAKLCIEIDISAKPKSFEDAKQMYEEQYGKELDNMKGRRTPPQNWVKTLLDNCTGDLYAEDCPSRFALLQFPMGIADDKYAHAIKKSQILAVKAEEAGSEADSGGDMGGGNGGSNGAGSEAESGGDMGGSNGGSAETRIDFSENVGDDDEEKRKMQEKILQLEDEVKRLTDEDFRQRIEAVTQNQEEEDNKNEEAREVELGKRTREELVKKMHELDALKEECEEERAKRQKMGKEQAREKRVFEEECKREREKRQKVEEMYKELQKKTQQLDEEADNQALRPIEIFLLGEDDIKPFYYGGHLYRAIAVNGRHGIVQYWHDFRKEYVVKFDPNVESVLGDLDPEYSHDKWPNGYGIQTRNEIPYLMYEGHTLAKLETADTPDLATENARPAQRVASLEGWMRDWRL